MKYYYSYYNGYSADQFAEDEYFQQWVLYADDGAEKFWNEFIKINPQQQQTILKAKEKLETLFEGHAFQPLSVEEKLVLKVHIYRQINQPLKTVSLLRRNSMAVLKVAALLIAVIVMPFSVFNKNAPFEPLIVERTGAYETKEIQLPDSTVIILNVNSSVTYNSKLAGTTNREIFLEGNAYFRVKKKVDHRPFTVHSNAVSIMVIGTEFNVDARSKATEIVLTSGKVKVGIDESKGSAVYMSPGEKVQLDTLQQAFVKSKTDTLLYKAWTNGKWNFSSTSLLEVTNLIHEYYGIETVYKDENAKRLKISAVIPVTDLGSFTNILAKTLDLKITEQNNQLLIQY